MSDIPIEYRVWDGDAAADYLGQSKDLFLRTTRHLKDFPPVLKMCEGRQPRWSAKAVIAWALRS